MFEKDGQHLEGLLRQPHAHPLLAKVAGAEVGFVGAKAAHPRLR